MTRWTLSQSDLMKRLIKKIRFEEKDLNLLISYEEDGNNKNKESY